MNHKKQHVYILLEYCRENCEILKVYATRKAGEEALHRNNSNKVKVTHHLIKKSVQGTTIENVWKYNKHLKDIVLIHKEEK